MDESIRGDTSLVRTSGRTLARRAGTAEPVTPALGEIARTVASLKAVAAEIDEAATKLYDARELLRVLHAQRPPPAVHPDDMRESVALRLEHEEQVAVLVAEEKQYQGILLERQAARRHCALS